MALIRDLLFQLSGSAMAEQEIVDELRSDPSTVRQCLERLGALTILAGPSGERRMWSAVPEEAPFDTVVAAAKAAGVDLRDSLAEFAAKASPAA
jgi:hypothetical protein